MRQRATAHSTIRGLALSLGSLALIGCAATGAGGRAAVGAGEPQQAPGASPPQTQPGALEAAESAPGRPIAEEEPEAPRVVTTTWQAICPAEMALVTRVKAAYCVDRWEGTLERKLKDGRAPWPPNLEIDGRERDFVAVSVKGRRPQGYISGEQAALVCEAAGKRLCSADEWVTACRGPKLTRYPYGNVRKPHVCNDRFKVLDNHPVPRLWKKAPSSDDPIKMWHPTFMNDKRLLLFDHTTVETGSMEGCTNEYGVYDMVGNLHEWVSDAEGTFRGGFFMDTFQNGQGCDYRTTGHGFEYHDYSTGFRCCGDVEWKETTSSSGN
ncbi:MAG: SUMF1/EgtB/PvdO family nonheme iron enzyme [Myxococcales bacterium]|nr:SUMF1/EgtB/PvdO family nonheme iron enzyme [Myxococcales bacterium]